MQSKFTNSKVKQFRDDFQNAVLELEKKYEVTIKLGTLTYDSTSVRGKMTALIGDRSNVLTKEDFKVGDIVGINHKKVNPNDTFTVYKINSKNIGVKGANGAMMRVSPSLLVKK